MKKGGEGQLYYLFSEKAIKINQKPRIGFRVEKTSSRRSLVFWRGGKEGEPRACKIRFTLGFSQPYSGHINIRRVMLSCVRRLGDRCKSLFKTYTPEKKEPIFIFFFSSGGGGDEEEASEPKKHLCITHTHTYIHTTTVIYLGSCALG